MLAPESTNSTKVYQLRALRRKGGGGATTWLKLRLWLVVDPCASSRGATIEAAFYPLGRSVPSCNMGADRPLQVAVVADPVKCKKLQKSKAGKAH